MNRSAINLQRLITARRNTWSNVMVDLTKPDAEDDRNENNIPMLFLYGIIVLMIVSLLVIFYNLPTTIQ